MRKHFPSASHSQHGAALIIVLAFVVLLTVMVLAFFSQTRSYQNLANSSFNDFKSATLGQSALQVVIGDLQQEIINGSTPSTSGTFTIYLPTTGSNAVPARFGNPALTSGTDPIPNLIRISSGSNTAALHPASNISSTTPALNGQYVSPARWNKHYLIPRDPSYSATQVGTNPDPNCGFTVPDWIYVTGTGPIANPTSNSPIIGRYAYAIFNEGGLLDANVAGYPTSMQAKQTISGTNAVWGYANKGSEAFADLHAIDMIDGEINDLIGWRNYASAQASGDFASGYQFPDNGNRYYDFIQSNTTGFLVTSTLTTSSGITDQPFTSRQQLIKFFTSGTYQLKPLQYLGTFSRDIEQPTFIPNPARPIIQAATNSTAAPYGTGNDAYGLDRKSDRTQDINPPLPLITVNTAFTRPDGSTAQPGESLLKKRFPLSRLGLILYTSTAQKNQNDPIYRNFGIYRSSASQPWTYDHGNASGIYRLSDITGREPDFVELLKAAINIGSLGKSLAWNTNGVTGWNIPGTYMQTQHSQDVQTALQTLQIFANIIDQYDNDSYPIRIQIQDISGNYRTVSGIEDLPYFSAIRNRLTFPTINMARLLLQPILWNPHNPNGIHSNTVPTSFRIRVEPVDSTQPTSIIVTYQPQNDYSQTPVKTVASTPLTVNAEWDMAEPDVSPADNTITFNAGASAGYYDFRQPTLLGDASYPANAHISSPSQFKQTTVDTGIIQVGITVSEFPTKEPGPVTPTADVYILKLNIVGSTPGVHLILEYLASDGSYVPYDTFAYWWLSNDPISISYTNTNTDALLLAILQACFANKGSTRAIDASIGVPAPAGSTASVRTIDSMTRIDPRTNRWSPLIADCASFIPAIGAINDYTYETFWGEPNTAQLQQPAGGQPGSLAFGVHVGGPQDGGFYGLSAGYSSANQYRGFQFPYWSENSTRATQQQSGESVFRYNVDPDGIARRAMAGYTSDPAAGGSANNLQGRPMANNNYASRPLILNRPFRSVADLGYVFRGTPWKNLDFSYPESGDAALLDVFCVNDNSNTDALIAGKVDLNTRQAPVLQAILQGAFTDETTSAQQSSTVAQNIAAALVLRTSSTAGPLVNKSDLVGTFTGTGNTPILPNATVSPDTYYTGFSISGANGVNGQPLAFITAQRESCIRALSDAGTTRVWNLLVDLVAQSGKIPSGLDKFVVEGEKHYWLHIAIDRLTGKVLDYQLEPVAE
jgi:Tfp pilus assembly protein PilX